MALRFAPGVDEATRRLLESVVRAGQLVQPGDTGSGSARPDSWTTAESGPNGDYEAAYRRLPKGRVIKESRIRRGADGPVGDGDTALFENLVTTVFEGGGDDLPRSVDYGEKTSVLLVPDAPERSRVDATLEVEWTYVGDVPADPEWATGPAVEAAFARSVPLAARPAVVELPEPQPRPRDELVAVVKTSEGGRDHLARAQARRELTEAMRQDPETLRWAVDELRAPGHSELDRTLVESLFGVGSDAALGAAAELIDDPKVSQRVRYLCLATATFEREPPLQLVAAVRGRVGDEDASLRRTSMMTLGNWARDARENDPDTARAYLSDILGGEVVPGPELRRDWREWVATLKALGNAGMPETLAAAREALESDQFRVRVTAVWALRFVEGTEAARTIVATMGSDTIPEVRESAVEAARWRGPDAMLTAVTRALMRDDTPDVRRIAANVIHQWSMDSPALWHTLKRAYDEEEEPRVRESLHSYMYPLTGAPESDDTGETPGLDDSGPVGGSGSVVPGSVVAPSAPAHALPATQPTRPAPVEEVAP